MDEGFAPALDETHKDPREVIMKNVYASWEAVWKRIFFRARCLG